jgi:hypothetical protein
MDPVAKSAAQRIAQQARMGRHDCSKSFFLTVFAGDGDQPTVDSENESGAAFQVEDAALLVRPQPSPQAAVVLHVPSVFFIVSLILILAHRLSCSSNPDQF